MGLEPCWALPHTALPFTPTSILRGRCYPPHAHREDSRASERWWALTKSPTVRGGALGRSGTKAQACSFHHHLHAGREMECFHWKGNLEIVHVTHFAINIIFFKKKNSGTFLLPNRILQSMILPRETKNAQLSLKSVTD